MTAQVALISEGTYPVSTGGVSVWCEQLVSGLPEVGFQVVALSGLDEPVRCALPPNVLGVNVLPLWEVRPARPVGAAGRAAFQAQYEALLEAMLSEAPEAEGDFARALTGLARLAQRVDLEGALAVPDNAEVLLHVWRRRANVGADLGTAKARGAFVLPAPSVADALEANMWLTHLLRPLGHVASGCDLTHAVSNGLSVLPAIATQAVCGVPFLLTEHGLYLRERYLTPPSRYLPANTRALLLRFYLLLTRAAYRLADLISPASSFNTRWQLHLGAAPHKLRPVYNGIDPHLFAQGDTEPAEPTVAWVGRVDPLKDLGTLIRAHALVQHHLPSAQLRMYGPIPQGNEAYEQACRQLIQDLGLSGRATFEGRVPSVAQAYHSGHVVGLSSISEGFPYSVIEAMATGRPMVATDVGGVREAVGDTGFVVPPRDPRAFAGACEELLRDDDLRRTLGRRARERVLTLFTVQHCLDAYAAMYAELRALKRENPVPLSAAVGG